MIVDQHGAGAAFPAVTTRFCSSKPNDFPQIVQQQHVVIDRIGPWAMLDVFLLAILVALVKLGQLATIVPGPGLVAFTAVVVLTILASQRFDPKLIWHRE